MDEGQYGISPISVIYAACCNGKRCAVAVQEHSYPIANFVIAIDTVQLQKVQAGNGGLLGIRTGVLMCVLCIATTGVSQLEKGNVPIEAQQSVKSGDDLFDKGDYAGAQKEFEAAIALAKDWYEPHFELGQTLSHLERPADAKQEFETALSLNPKCWICHEGLGNLADDSGDHLLAIEEYQKASSLAPTNARLKYNLGITYVRMGKTEDAVAALKHAEELKPDYASPFFLLGNVYFEQKKFYLASDQFLQATKLEKSGSRYEQAKKLNDMQIIVDEKLKGNEMGNHMSYCLARAGAMTPESYHKRFPGAETYVEDLSEEEYVYGTFATILTETGKKLKSDPDLARLVTVQKAGYLVPFIIASSGDRFAKDAAQFEIQHPGRIEEFRKWAAENKISLSSVQPRCEVRWMGETW